ncbi:hypothetical protein E5676_scaffold195G00650 [Cucumis melo var. makuwa]|uniref:Uncharacterized protein n=1 Tax=Cucumis melo var. makuwa TaxID=1194695 RepID=A0A5D3DGA4_CUCMM|nr:hypothetical protein E5676_scaffold195G00650 [Cucumis melo var. makuwa]
MYLYTLTSCSAEGHKYPNVMSIVVMLMGCAVNWNNGLVWTEGITRLICASFGITRLICASFGITRLICASFRITRLICASFGITRLICASDDITRLIDVCVLQNHWTVYVGKGMARGRPARGKKDA